MMSDKKPPIKWNEIIGYVEKIVNTINHADQIDQYKENVMEKLACYVSNEPDFEKFINYDKSGFTKNLVADFGNICNIILMCWAPGQMSSIHSHNGSKCFVKVLEGQLDELRFAKPSEPNPVVHTDLSEQKSDTLSKNSVTYIDDSIGAHKVTNESNDRPAISLHIYVPAYKTSKVYMPIEHNGGQKIQLSIDRCHSVDLQFFNQQPTISKQI